MVDKRKSMNIAKALKASPQLVKQKRDEVSYTDEFFSYLDDEDLYIKIRTNIIFENQQLIIAKNKICMFQPYPYIYIKT